MLYILFLKEETKMSRKKKQQGVVLLSCLIFLLLLLTLLRFNLNSTAMQEIKTGADYDQLVSYETTSRVMAAAEYAVLSNFSKLSGDLESEDNMKEMMNYWTKKDLPDRKGLIDGDASNSVSSIWSKAEEVNGGGNEILGEYVIERFMGNGKVLGMGNSEQETVILRITARGYGVGDETSKTNRISSTLQNTYILSKVD